MKKTFKYIVATLAVILTVSSISLYTVRHRLLDPNTYTNALENSGIYQEIGDLLAEQITKKLVAIEKKAVSELDITKNDNFANNLLFWTVNSVIESQTGPLVKYALDTIGVEQLLQKASKIPIQYTLEWLSGKRDTPFFIKYMPTKAELDAVRNIRFNDVVVLITRRALNIDNLPQCKNNKETVASLSAIRKGNILDIACTTPEIDPLINLKISGLIPKELTKAVEGPVQKFIAETNLQPVIDQAYAIAVEIDGQRASLLALRQRVALLKHLAVWMFILSLIAAISAVVLAEKKRVRFLAQLYFIGGLIICAVGALGYLVLPSIVLNILDLGRLAATDVIAPTLALILIESIKIFASSVTRSLFAYTLILGLAVTVIAAVVYAADMLARRFDLYKKGIDYLKKLTSTYKNRKR
ncbi:MAG: hypothetical protein HQ596_01190 [Candidatus Saganbacteria bacterium]|nr:hypothetical protein [Candidatus Saganbacteria bacterium]